MGVPSFLTEVGREPLDFDVLQGAGDVSGRWAAEGRQLEVAVGGWELRGRRGGGGVGEYGVNPLLSVVFLFPWCGGEATLLHPSLSTSL